MIDIAPERILRRDNRRFERDNQPGAASRRAMREDRRIRHRGGHNGQPRTKPNIAAFRRAELIRIYESRWGPELPDDDSGLDDVRLFADHCGESDFDILKRFCAKHAPWMTAEEIVGAWNPGNSKTRPFRERNGIGSASTRPRETDWWTVGAG